MYIFRVSDRCNITVDDLSYEECVTHLRGCFGDSFVYRLLNDIDLDIYQEFVDYFQI